ncbi:hypothetical protein O181_031091 [Austropuccinia psidii MF-1]|uniref:Uncharacterized protein n=1 Tax=Austropuccinia psidii MF-1 TaxID=1389203 RepID=A0A9Q3CZS8_9BASI|nr:hypothetical protein [Austropuccinia psidii MF-1]
MSPFYKSEMRPPHHRDLGYSRDNSIQRPSTIRRNRDLKGREVEVDKSNKIWQNGPLSTFQDDFQQQHSSKGLHRIRTNYPDPSNAQIPSPMENGRQGIQPKAPLEFFF